MHALRFPQKLWRMANECSTNAVRWSSNGKSIILNYKELQEQYLPSNVGLFKTNNITSFIRQLNLYGFKKVSHSESRAIYKGTDFHEFRNDHFVQGRFDLLKFVTRKSELQPAKIKNRHMDSLENEILLTNKCLVKNKSRSTRKSIAQRAVEEIVAGFSFSNENAYDVQASAAVQHETQKRNNHTLYNQTDYTCNETIKREPSEFDDGSTTSQSSGESNEISNKHQIDSAKSLVDSEYGERPPSKRRKISGESSSCEYIIGRDLLLSQSSGHSEDEFKLIPPSGCGPLCRPFCTVIPPTQFVREVFGERLDETAKFIFSPPFSGIPQRRR